MTAEKIAEVAFVGVIVVIILLALLGCQVSHTVEIHDAQSVTVTMTGNDGHGRGGQTTDVLREAQTELGIAP